MYADLELIFFSKSPLSDSMLELLRESKIRRAFRVNMIVDCGMGEKHRPIECEYL